LLRGGAWLPYGAPVNFALRAVAFFVVLGALPVGAQAPADPAKPAADRPRLFVNELVPQSATPQQAQAFTDAVVQALSARGVYEVLSTRDLQGLIGAERQKQLLGLCTDPSSPQCTADLSQAVTARFLLTGQLARLGRTYQLTLQTLDVEKSQPVARSTRVAGSLEELTALVPYLAAEATGSPLPPPPSKVLPIGLMAAGGGAFIAGGVVGLLSLSRAQALNEELCPGGALPTQRCAGLNLKPRDFYVQKSRELAGQQALAVGLLAGGAALAALGVWLFPPEVRAAKVAVAPTSNGLMFSGELP